MSDKQLHTEFRVAVMSGAIVIPSAFLLWTGGTKSTLPVIPMLTGFGLWALSPFVMLCLLSFRIRSTPMLVSAAVMMFAVEIYANAAMRVAPHSVFAARLFICLPVYLYLFVLPTGLAVGWIGMTAARWLASRRPHPASD